MSLKLNKVAVVSPKKLAKQAQAIYGMIDELEEQIAKEYNVSRLPEPDGQPLALTEVDVTALENRDLGQLHTQYVAYSVFLNDRLIKLVCLEKAAKKNVKEVVAQLKTELRVAGVKQTEIGEKVELHPLYKEYSEEALKLSFMKEIVEGKHKGYKEMAAALSRNISLRELEFEQTRREHSVSKSTGGAVTKRQTRTFGAAK